MKKKGIAAILALLFGVFGIHRFYLGQRVKGIIYFALFILTLSSTVEGFYFLPPIILPALIAFADAILFAVMPKEDFNHKYNSRYMVEQATQTRRSRTPHKRRVMVEPNNSFKETGMRKYDSFDIEGAITDFRKALNSKFKDSQVHFLIACCYSINEEPEKSLFHLDKAVDFGFVDFDKIHKVDALAFLRTHNRFEEFVKNSYQIPRYLPENEDNLLDQMEDAKATDLLDQIAALGALYEKGVLTPAEFQKQKQQLLNG